MTTPIADLQQRTQGHLKILGVCFIVFGVFGIFGLLGAGAILHLVQQVLQDNGNMSDMAPELEEMLLSVLPTLKIGIVLLTGVHIFFNALVGVCLMRYKYYWPCYIAGVLTIPAIPLGTALGVATLMVMSRPEARALFGLASRPGCPPAMPGPHEPA